MPKTWSFPPAVVVTALTAFLGGGLAGAIFSWFVNRPEPTVMTYLVYQTELADPKASVLIPDLSVRVGKEIIQELRAYTIEIDIPRGARSGAAEVGIFFPHKVRIYGKSTEAPSQLYSMNCDQLDNGLRCQMSPVSRANNKGYRIVLATDEKESPRVEVVAKDVEVLSAPEFAARKSGMWEAFSSSKALGTAGFVLLVVLLFIIQLRLLRRVRRDGPGIVVGKIINPEGNPVKDADVEVVLESPSHNFPPVTTDRFGDFLLGGLRKFSLYKGRIRVSHSDYTSIETPIDSPIVCLKLERNAKEEK